MLSKPTKCALWLSAALLLLALGPAGCQLEDGVDGDATESVGEVEDALFLEAPVGSTPGVIWPRNANGYTYVPICFRAAGTKGLDCGKNEYSNTCEKMSDGTYKNCYTAAEWQKKKDLVRDALSSSWELWTKIRFTGYGTCPSSYAGFIAIDMIRSTNFGGCSDVGYRPTGDLTSFITDTPDWRLQRSVIIHEIGHALGFHHEMDRPDAKYSNGSFICTDSPVTFNTGAYLTSYYDDVSIMNYCAPANRNSLSTGDIEGAQSIYGQGTAEPWRKAAASLALYAM